MTPKAKSTGGHHTWVFARWKTAPHECARTAEIATTPDG